MTSIQVTPQELQRVSGELSGGAGSIQDQNDRMKRQIDDLVQSNWVGAASSSFQELYEKWNTSARNLNESLNGISAMLAESARLYQEQEDELARKFRQ